MLSSYCLQPKKDRLELYRGEVKWGLVLMDSKPRPVGRKLFIFKAKSKAPKEVKEEKQLTINGALRE
jgi:hypothetical protein